MSRRAVCIRKHEKQKGSAFFADPFCSYFFLFCILLFPFSLLLFYLYIIVYGYRVLNVGVRALCGFYIEINRLHEAYAAHL